jgi:hypothetical protein
MGRGGSLSTTAAANGCGCCRISGDVFLTPEATATIATTNEADAAAISNRPATGEKVNCTKCCCSYGKKQTIFAKFVVLTISPLLFLFLFS